MRILERRLSNSRARVGDRLYTEHLTDAHHLRLTEIVNHRAERTALRHLTRYCVLGELIDREHERINRVQR